MSTLQAPPADPLRLRAMELRGGNDAASERLSCAGFEAYIYSRPHGGDPRGGDLHFISTCAMGHIFRLTLADLAGHGDQASELALRLRTLLRKHINTPNPTKLARALNNEFSRLADGGRFATACITTYFAPTDHLIICNAGHPRPLLYRCPAQDRPGGWELFDHASPHATAPQNARHTGIANLPLGVISRADYPFAATLLAPGDVVIAYTDALIEAADPSGHQLGQDGLLNLARQINPAEHPERIAKAILDGIFAHTGGADPQDDVTLIVLCHTATNPPDGAWPRLKALGRVVGLIK
jgi:sigma-B regulation protein RsbU (phosphoserine phosphatase)